MDIEMSTGNHRINTAVVSRCVLGCVCLLHSIFIEASDNHSPDGLFNPAAPFELKVNNTWELYLRIKISSRRWSQVAALALPSNANFESLDDAWYRISWSPSIDDIGPHLFVFEGSDPDSPTSTIRDELTVEVTGERIHTQPVSPFPTHIVSAGQTVSLDIDVNDNGSGNDVLSLRPLPDGASFDQRDNGLYRFYWPTKMAKKGEYGFVISKIDPESVASGFQQKLTIIVTDPSGSSSTKSEEQMLPSGLPSEISPSESTPKPAELAAKGNNIQAEEKPQPQPSAVPPGAFDN